MALHVLSQASTSSLDARSEREINCKDLVRSDLEGFASAACMLTSGRSITQSSDKLISTSKRH